jgi:hypothetical protein
MPCGRLSPSGDHGPHDPVSSTIIDRMRAFGYHGRMTEIETLNRLLARYLPEYALVPRSALLDPQRVHLLHLEAIARAKHGLQDWEPVPAHLAPTPLLDEILGDRDEERASDRCI